MIPVTLAQLAQDCMGDLGGHAGALVTDISTDTRSLSGGELFVAIRGERVDGASLAGQAIRAGAVGVLTSDPETAVASGAPADRLVVVPDVVQALGAVARGNLERARSYGNPDLTVVAVTGSVGKTTTKDLLAAILAERGPIIAPPGSFNNEIGLPMTVLRADANTATLVLEMGADHIGNIEYLTSIASPDVAAVLIVARAHLGEFGGIENVARAKSEIIVGSRPGAIAVLNADDARVTAMRSLATGPVVTFSAVGNADVFASDITTDAAGHASFVLHHGQESLPVTLQLVGVHHVSNALAAASVAIALGTSLRHVAGVLSSSGPASPHRMDVRVVDGVTIIDDSYNANPDSMRAGLAGLGHVGLGHRKIAVLGEMLELGDASAAEHAALASVAKEAGVDILVCVGSGTRALSASAIAEGLNVINAENPDSALVVLSKTLEPGDAVLVKGSNGSGVWRIADALNGKGK